MLLLEDLFPITEKSFKRLAQREAAEHIDQTELCDWKCDCRSLK